MEHGCRSLRMVEKHLSMWEKILNMLIIAMWINPNNNNHWLIGCDGGIYETFDAKNWDF